MTTWKCLGAAFFLTCVAACGGGSAAPSPARTQESAVKYAQCLREHGVETDDPGAEGGVRLKVPSGGEATLKKAQEACKPYAPVATEKGAGEIPAADQAKFIAYAKCMREHGVDLPDPQFDGGRARLGLPRQEGMSADSPVMKNAEKACRPLLPQGGGQ
ncbi:hypothetical protein [Nonomuraea bangladeshensis]|uniref:hypothetical protein n=1 Tax=Nonomuraea bangladeshensis TaxID=404385 RepID=UPI003C2D88D0